jgi:hypothetical protein
MMMTHQLVGGGRHQTGYIALLHPNALALSQPQYLAEHRLLSFLGKKICYFIHDCQCILVTGRLARISGPRKKHESEIQSESVSFFIYKYIYIYIYIYKVEKESVALDS